MYFSILCVITPYTAAPNAKAREVFNIATWQSISQYGVEWRPGLGHMDVKKAVDFNRGAVAKYYCPFLDFIINTSGNGIVVVVGDVSVGGIGIYVIVPLLQRIRALLNFQHIWSD